jgi:hypothetical protein
VDPVPIVALGDVVADVVINVLEHVLTNVAGAVQHAPVVPAEEIVLDVQIIAKKTVVALPVEEVIVLLVAGSIKFLMYHHFSYINIKY